MSPGELAAAVLFAVCTLGLAPGAVRDWRRLHTARDTDTIDRHRDAMDALR